MDAAAVTLPPELERVIFELAAWQSRKTIFTLILVAKKVCAWIEPELYHVLLFKLPEQAVRMLQSKPPEFLRQHVHHVALASTFEHTDVARLLSTCTSIRNFAFWTGNTYPELVPLLCKLTNLQRLSIDLFDLFGGDTELRIPPCEELPFTHITHLDILGLVSPELWPVFAMLPRLTHLCFSDVYLPDAIRAAFDLCERLELLVVIWIYQEDRSGGEEQSEITDPRLCIIDCEMVYQDWELGARGGVDFWRQGEQMVEMRRRQIKASTEGWIIED
ncbi:hypothetical protein B0H16DRAFT_1629875 [Mycena metata]|uniref:Uncharacterized protein n=1 Tax=Mycena metata TaxID=1033252 RepID=A0AAD7H3K5_9AGAR|nr:hypothetical protein B0H16DRAFT_1629875 [Mycena metata]